MLQCASHAYRGFYAADIRAKCLQLFYNVFVTTLNVCGLVNFADTIRGKGSHDHCRTGTQIQRAQRGGLQLFHTLNNGDLAIDLDVSTHADQLVHIAEAVFPDAFRYNGSAIGQRQ